MFLSSWCLKKENRFRYMILKKGNDAVSLISIRVNRQDIIEGKIEREKKTFHYTF